LIKIFIRSRSILDNGEKRFEEGSPKLSPLPNMWSLLQLYTEGAEEIREGHLIWAPVTESIGFGEESQISLSLTA